MKTLIALSLTILLAGCAEFQAVKSGIASHGSEAADQTVDVNLWALCEAATVGSIKRRFKTTEEMDAYNSLCVGTLP